jgi:hypothetical protein
MSSTSNSSSYNNGNITKSNSSTSSVMNNGGANADASSISSNGKIASTGVESDLELQLGYSVKQEASAYAIGTDYTSAVAYTKGPISSVPGGF